MYLFEWYELNSYCRLNVDDLYFQGSDSWAEAPREYQPIPIHFSHHQQSSGTLYNPCLRKKARLPPKVWKMEIIKLCRFTCRFVKIYQSSYQSVSVQKDFSLFLQISGITGLQPGLQLPLQLCNALARCPPGPYQHRSYYCCCTFYCLHAQSDTSLLCRPGHIICSAGL